MGGWCSGRESNPYTQRARDFLHTTPFDAGRWPFVRWTMPSPWCYRTVGARRLVSTPSLIGLGSALPRRKGRGFTEFDGIHAGAFASRCSIP